MSTFPKARKSTITNVRVTPDKWDAHPEVSRSTISNSVFTHLSSATQISTSLISNTTIEDLSSEGAPPKNSNNYVNSSQVHDSAIFSSEINRCKLEHCSVTDSVVNRSTLKQCTIVPPRNRVERTTASTTKFMGAKLVNRSQLEDSVVLSGSTVERCTVRNSVVADGAVCDRTKMDNVTVTRSRLDRSNLANCDVMDCVMDRTTFGWMTLRNGIWKNGDLVGRPNPNEEVVIQPRTGPMQKSPDLTPSTSISTITDSFPPVAGPLREAPPMPEPGWKAAEAADEQQLDDSDHIDDALSSEDEPSTDDELIGPGSRSVSKSQSKSKSKSKSTVWTPPVNSSRAIADQDDPPPPYEA